MFDVQDLEKTFQELGEMHRVQGAEESERGCRIYGSRVVICVLLLIFLGV